MAELEHRIEIEPAKHWIKDDPKRNYGVIGMRMSFYVIGPKGAIQWVISPGWYVPLSREHLRAHGWPSIYDERNFMRPAMAYDLGYHAHEQQYEGQSQTREECHLLHGPCYYDGTSCGADDLIEGFIAGGTPWLWEKLDAVYRSRFEDGEYPDFTPQDIPHPDDTNPVKMNAKEGDNDNR